jgi:hypothetical protein
MDCRHLSLSELNLVIFDVSHLYYQSLDGSDCYVTDRDVRLMSESVREEGLRDLTGSLSIWVQVF